MKQINSSITFYDSKKVLCYQVILLFNVVSKQHISTYVRGRVLQRLRIYSWWFALEVANANIHTLKLAAALHTFGSSVVRRVILLICKVD